MFFKQFDGRKYFDEIKEKTHIIDISTTMIPTNLQLLTGVFPIFSPLEKINAETDIVDTYEVIDLRSFDFKCFSYDSSGNCIIEKQKPAVYIAQVKVDINDNLILIINPRGEKPIIKMNEQAVPLIDTYIATSLRMINEVLANNSSETEQFDDKITTRDKKCRLM